MSQEKDLLDSDLLQDPHFKIFLDNSFSVKNYVEESLQNPRAPDLTHAINGLDTAIKEKVTDSQELLLVQASNVSLLSQDLVLIRDRVDSIHSRLSSLNDYIKQPYQMLATTTKELENIQKVSTLCRHTLQFLHLARQLKVHLKSSGDQCKAAEYLFQLEELRMNEHLFGIQAVDNEIEWINEAKDNLLKKTHTQFTTGCSSLNQNDTANACQIFYHLHRFQDIIQEWRAESVKKGSMLVAFDVQNISSNPTNKDNSITTLKLSQVSVPLSQEDFGNIWKKFELLLQNIYQHLQQNIHLQKVLQNMIHPTNNRSNMWALFQQQQQQQQQQPAGDLIEPLWDVICEQLGLSFRALVKRDPIVQSVLVNEYPKVVRALYELVGRLESYLDYDDSTSPQYNESPSTIKKYDTIVTSFEWLEPQYFSKIALHLEKHLTKFPITKETLAEDNGRDSQDYWDQASNLNIISSLMHTVKNELDSLSSDPHTKSLLYSKFVDVFVKVSKKKYFKELSDYLIQKPSSPLTLKAQQVEAKSEAPQIHNATLFNVNNHFMHELRIVFSHHFPDNLKDKKNNSKHSTNQNSQIIELQSLLKSFQENLLNPIFINIIKLLSSTLEQVRKINFESLENGDSSAVCSPYVTSFHNQIAFFIKNILSLFSQSPVLLEKIKWMVKKLGFYYLELVCPIRPLSEMGKLKLAADMTQVEFALSLLHQFKDIEGGGFLRKQRAIEGPLEYELYSLERHYRAYRSLLFKEINLIPSCEEVTKILSPFLVLHHLCSYFSPSEFNFPKGNENWFTQWVDFVPNYAFVNSFEIELNQYQNLIDKRGESKYALIYPVFREVILFYKKIVKA